MERLGITYLSLSLSLCMYVCVCARARVFETILVSPYYYIYRVNNLISAITELNHLRSLLFSFLLKSILNRGTKLLLFSFQFCPSYNNDEDFSDDDDIAVAELQRRIRRDTLLLRDDGKSKYFCLLNLILDSKYDVIRIVNENYIYIYNK
jgi:hypothetical protein